MAFARFEIEKNSGESEQVCSDEFGQGNRKIMPFLMIFQSGALRNLEKPSEMTKTIGEKMGENKQRPLGFFFQFT